jgi:hypothetical protein
VTTARPACASTMSPIKSTKAAFVRDPDGNRLEAVTFLPG